MDKYENRNFHRHGQGVFVNGVEQIRDKFLDVKLRIEAAKLGTESGRLEALDALSGVYDEQPSVRAPRILGRKIFFKDQQVSYSLRKVYRLDDFRHVALCGRMFRRSVILSF